MARALRLGACGILAALFWWIPPTAAVPAEGWRLLGIFAGVILGFLLRPFPMGPMVLFGLLAAAATGTLSLKAALAGYGDKTVWLVIGAFLLAGAVRGTGLGRRIALWLVARLGRTTLGLGYAQAAAELVLGPLVPSNTARGGGILAPISASLSSAMDADATRAGRYLSLVGAHANLVTAAMFLTGMAANPLFARAATDVYGVKFGWTEWALAACVPGLVALALLPLVLYALSPPGVRGGRPAQEAARRQLEPWTRPQIVTAVVFVAMLGLWVTKALDTTLVAWLGVAALVLSGTRAWEDLVGDSATWDTMIWLGGLLAMAGGLSDLGVVKWFAGEAEARVAGHGMLVTLLLLAAVYFYSMYGFSMLTAHIAAMAPAFLLVCKAAGAPAMLAVPLFAVFSNLCACTTNYSTGPVIVYYGLGHVGSGRWFGVGFVMSLFHMVVWIPIGLGWWKLLGWW